MELDALKFTVETTALDDAITKVGTLQLAVKKLGSDTGSQSARQVAKEQNDILKDKIKLETEVIGLQAKRLVAEKKVRDAQADTSASEKANGQIDKMVTKLELLEKYLGQGLVKSFAGTMAQVEMIGGATADQLGRFDAVFANLSKLMKNPLDDAIGPLQSITRELDKMTARVNLQAQGISLTNKQLEEYSKITSSIESQQRSREKSLFDPSTILETNKLIQKAQDEYLCFLDKFICL